MDKATASDELAGLREGIDALDTQILDLLNRRAEMVVKIGEYKRAKGTPIYVPHREAEVLERVLVKNPGPLSGRCVERIYRELMSGSFALERPLRIAYLGPEASHSHVAARLQFGASVDYLGLESIEEVFREVQRAQANYALVPIENSAGGSIVDTLDAYQNASEQVVAYAEIQVQVRHNLLSRGEAATIRKIYSKPEVFAQCRKWIASRYPKAELLPASSSSRAAELVAQQSAEEGSSCAAIGSLLAAQHYGLPSLFESIEDNPNNITRFLVIGLEKARPSGDDKTSLMLSTLPQAGALSEVLQVFAQAKISLTHIDKRPSGRENWTYTFFIDALGHIEDPSFAAVLERVREHCAHFRVLGSYPRARRIL